MDKIELLPLPEPHADLLDLLAFCQRQVNEMTAIDPKFLRPEPTREQVAMTRLYLFTRAMEHAYADVIVPQIRRLIEEREAR